MLGAFEKNGSATHIPFSKEKRELSPRTDTKQKSACGKPHFNQFSSKPKPNRNLSPFIMRVLFGPWCVLAYSS
jgi:hypothetical protein